MGMSEEIVRQLAEDLGATKLEFLPLLPDGTGGAVMSLPLREDHWIYGDRAMERKVCEPDIWHEPPPMVFRLGTDDQASLLVQRENNPEPFKCDPPVRMRREDFAEKIRIAGRYAIRAATLKGKEMDFDPDALIQNLVVGMLGYWTTTGLSSMDEWANPEASPATPAHHEAENIEEAR
jgi:hypothetical protein